MQEFPKSRVLGLAETSAEFDAFRLLNAFADDSLRQIHIAPFTAKVHELVDTKLPDPVTGEANRWSLQQQKPNLYRMLHNWNEYLITGTNLPGVDPAISHWMRVASNNMAYAYLSANLRSAGIQLSTLRNTYYKLGLEYTLKGIASSLSDALSGTKNREFAMKNSNVLDIRSSEAAFDDIGASIMGRSAADYLQAIREGRWSEAQAKIARPGFKVLEALDREAATYSWNGAYKYAKEKLGYDHTASRHFADDLVVDTQGSAAPGDLSAIQRNAFGKAATQFQTFVISEWNFLTRDVFGYKNPEAFMHSPTRFESITGITVPQAIKNVTRLAMATAAINTIYEDVLKFQAPFPSPIRDLAREWNPNDTALRKLATVAGTVVGSAIEPVPILSASRYGKGIGGPALETYRDFTRSIRGDPLAEPAFKAGDTPVEAMLRLMGTPAAKMAGVPGAQQSGKYLRAVKRGEPFWQSLTGWYSQEGPQRLPRSSSGNPRARY